MGYRPVPIGPLRDICDKVGPLTANDFRTLRHSAKSACSPQLCLVVHPPVLAAFALLTSGAARMQHSVARDGEGEPTARARLSDCANGFRRADRVGDA